MQKFFHIAEMYLYELKSNNFSSWNSPTHRFLCFNCTILTRSNIFIFVLIDFRSRQAAFFQNFINCRNNFIFTLIKKGLSHGKPKNIGFLLINVVRNIFPSQNRIFFSVHFYSALPKLKTGNY